MCKCGKQRNILVVKFIEFVLNSESDLVIIITIIIIIVVIIIIIIIIVVIANDVFSVFVLTYIRIHRRNRYQETWYVCLQEYMSVCMS